MLFCSRNSKNIGWGIGALVLAISGPVVAQSTSPQVEADLPVVPQELTLTLDQAEDFARDHNPQILGAHQTVESARLNLKSQRAPVNPTIGYSGINNTVGSTSFGDASNYVGYVTLETSGAEHWRTSTARAQLKGASFDATTASLNIAQAVADAYSGLQAANSLLQNEHDVYGMTQKVTDLSEQQFKLGAAPETNAIRSEIALTQESQNLVAAKAAVLMARANLNLAMGQPADTPVDTAQPLAYKKITLPPYDLLLKTALANRPEIQSSEAARWAADAAVGMQQSQYYPNVVVGKAFDSTDAQIGFTFPVDLGSIGEGVRKAKSDVKVQQDQTQQIRNQVTLDVHNAYIALAQSQVILASYDDPDGIMPRSQSLLDRVTSGYSLGASSILDLIDAQQTYRATRNNYISAIGAYNQAVDQMNRAIGGDFTLLNGK